jgi:hypothetical protein
MNDIKGRRGCASLGGIKFGGEGMLGEEKRCGCECLLSKSASVREHRSCGRLLLTVKHKGVSCDIRTTGPPPPSTYLLVSCACKAGQRCPLPLDWIHALHKLARNSDVLNLQPQDQQKRQLM